MNPLDIDPLRLKVIGLVFTDSTKTRKFKKVVKFCKTEFNPPIIPDKIACF